MSHGVTIDLVIDEDLNTLRATCKALGGELREGQKTYKWFGRFVGDSPPPAGFTAEDLGKCEHAIHFPDCQYEIGICKNPNGEGYVPVFDYWDHSIRNKVGGQTAPKLRQRYAIEKARREAARTGHDVEEVTQPDGSVRLMIVKKTVRQRYSSQWNRMVKKAREVVGVGA